MASLNDTDVAVCNTNVGAHVEGISKEEMVTYYNKWAEKDSNSYDQDMISGEGRYNGPIYGAQTLSKYLGDKWEARILDVAAGTGFLGVELSKLGYNNIDAFDPAEGMLEVAGKKNVYSKLICDFWTEDVTTVDTDSYDALGIAGGMGEGHIPTNSLKEMIRVVKPGGVIVIVMREQYLSIVPQYKSNLEPLMKELESEEKWTIEERTVVPRYSFGNNGVIFVYRVL